MPATQKHPALAEFAATRDELAFARVVEEFGGLVFTSARRRCGDRELAEEIAQNVFAIAARKARRLASHPALTGWFYTTVKLEAAKALRTRGRHQRRIKALANEMKSNPSTTTPMSSEDRAEWLDALPLLDESLDRLSAADRQIVLGRFFEQRSFREIAERSGKSEAACKMRLKRTLGRLNRSLAGRGVSLSAAALATGLSAELSKAAPSSVAAALPSGAIAASSGLGTATILTNTLNTMSTAKSVGLAALAVISLGVIPVALQQSEANHLGDELADLREHLADTSRSRSIHGRTGSSTRPGDQDGTSPGRPVARLLAEIDRPLEVDELIEVIASAAMSRDMGKIMRVMMPLVRLTPEEGERLLADVQASDKSQQMKAIAMQMLPMMFNQPDAPTGETLDRHLASGVNARNIASQLREFAKADPEAAIAWFESRRNAGQLVGEGVDGAPERYLFIGLVGGLAEGDPDRAIALLETVDTDTRHDAILDLAATLVLDTGKRARALALVQGVEPLEVRSRAAESAASSLVRRGLLDEAAAFVHAADLDHEQIAAAIGSAAMAGSGDGSRTFAQRVTWAEQNSPGDAVARARLIRELAGSAYHHYAPDTISAWVDSLAEGTERDAGLAAESGALSMNDQSLRALERAQEISDPVLRAEEVKRVFTWVDHRSPEAAARLAREQGLELGDILATE